MKQAGRTIKNTLTGTSFECDASGVLETPAFIFGGTRTCVAAYHRFNRRSVVYVEVKVGRDGTMWQVVEKWCGRREAHGYTDDNETALSDYLSIIEHWEEEEALSRCS